MYYAFLGYQNETCCMAIQFVKAMPRNSSVHTGAWILYSGLDHPEDGLGKAMPSREMGVVSRQMRTTVMQGAGSHFQSEATATWTDRKSKPGSALDHHTGLSATAVEPLSAGAQRFALRPLRCCPVRVLSSS